MRFGLTDTITWSNIPQHDKLIRDLKKWVGDTKIVEPEPWRTAEENAFVAERKRREEEAARTTVDRSTLTESLENSANGYVPPITDYSLVRRLGNDGICEMWYAKNNKNNEAIVKALNTSFLGETQVEDRFRNVAMITSKLRHPNIQQVYEYSILNGRPSLVAEYLEGEDLKAYMDRGVMFTDEQLRKWWNQLASALNYMHGQGVVHLDIIPSQIFLTSKGNVKIMPDICNSKIEEEHTTLIGTLWYMSPEQIKCAEYLDERSDSYSLAVTFVQLLSGRRHPYASDSDFEIRKQIEEHPLDMTGVPAAWQRFLKPYLAKNPAERPGLIPFSS